jgi:hypothetical protein
MDDFFTINERRCKICSSKLREQIDGMILGDSEIDGRKYKYSEIQEWAAGQGLTISPAAITRHRVNHVMPSMRRMLETERNMDAIEKATGKKLSLPRVFTGMVLSKILRVLEDFDEDQLDNIDPIKLLREGTRAAQAALQIEKAESLLSPKEVVDTLAEKVTDGTIKPETLSEIKRVYGLE